MKNTKRLVCLATIASAGLCGQLQAAELYTNKSDFSNQVSNTKLINFNTPSLQRSFNAFPLVIDGLSLSVNQPGYNTSGNSLTSISDELGYYSIDGSQFAAIDLVSSATFTLTFGSQTQGFGASFVGLANNGRTEIIKLLKVDGSLIESFTYNGSVNGGLEPSFLGFVSQTPFFAVSFSHVSNSINDVIGMDNLIVASAVAAIPEPATWLTMLVGFGMVGSAARYRRRSSKVTYA